MKSLKNNTNASVLVNSISVFIPVKSFKVDFEYITKSSVPAITQTAINLIGLFDNLSISELQIYFGLNSQEINTLVSDLIKTTYIFENSEGNLQVTEKFRDIEVSWNDQIVLDEFKNYFGDLWIDTITNSIQFIDRKSYALKGLKTFSKENNSIDVHSLFKEQFNRYKDTSKKVELQSGASKLYKINRCEYIKMENLVLTIDFSLRHDMDGLQITMISNLQEQNSFSNRLIQNSGLYLETVEFLINRQPPKSFYDFEQYIHKFKDIFLTTYVYPESVKFSLFLKDYLNDRIKNTDEDTLIVGPIYLDKNKTLFLKFISEIDFNIPENNFPILWRPSNDEFWGASENFKSFSTEVDKLSELNFFELAICVPNIEKRDEKDYKFKFNKFVNSLYLLNYHDKSNGYQELSELEFMIFDGHDKFAFVQYSYYDESLHNGLPIKVGYLTRNIEKISIIKDYFKKSNVEISSVKMILPDSDEDNFGNTKNYVLDFFKI
ncbi:MULTISPECIES: hypothetical protein [Acinetobacter]|uniref:hypothetical protein n=1 Tax=Acinetobacter pittii TaxID=48296 RepID=UPI00198048CB|nr:MULTISPECIES: hypothetical protein [Acinetobacter]MBN6530091.1 hypothetical protein [Acinetobacter pittii]